MSERHDPNAESLTVSILLQYWLDLIQDMIEMQNPKWCTEQWMMWYFSVKNNKCESCSNSEDRFGFFINQNLYNYFLHLVIFCDVMHLFAMWLYFCRVRQSNCKQLYQKNKVSSLFDIHNVRSELMFLKNSKIAIQYFLWDLSTPNFN